MIMIINYN